MKKKVSKQSRKRASDEAWDEDDLKRQVSVPVAWSYKSSHVWPVHADLDESSVEFLRQVDEWIEHGVKRPMHETWVRVQEGANVFCFCFCLLFLFVICV